MKKYLPLGLVLFFGLLLRIYHNLDISLWHDEAFSALMIRYHWSEMFYRLGLDVHPPVYYIFLRFWHNLFGDTLLALRSFSILFGVGTIWAGWLFFGEAFKNEKGALWAAVLIAFNPFQLQYVTEARMYTMGAFFALMAGYFLVKGLNAQKDLWHRQGSGMPNLPESFVLRKSIFGSYFGFTLCLIVIIYTHYYLFFTAAALGFYGLLFLIFHHGGSVKKYLPISLSFAAAVLAFLPWLKTFLFQYSQVQAGYWIQKMDRWSIPSTFWDMLLGFGRDTSKSITQLLLVAVTLFSLFMFYRLLKKIQSFHKWLLAVCVAAPFLGALLFGLLARLKGSNSSVYLDRYFLFASVYFSMAAALWLKDIRPKWLSVSLFLLYIILNLAAYSRYWVDLNVTKKPGMSKAAQFLRQNVQPADKIIVASPFMFFNFKYYWTEPAFSAPASDRYTADPDTNYYFFNEVRPLLYSDGAAYTRDFVHYAGSALLSDSDLLPSYKNAGHTGDNIWVIWTNSFDGKQPEVPQNWTKLDEKGYAEVRPYAGTWVIVTEYKVN